MSLESIPTWFSDTMDISLEAAQAVLSIAVLLAVLLPIMYLSRNRRGFVIEIVMIFLSESLLVGIGWLPFWLLIATVCVLALAIALLGTRLVTGG
jgi:cell division protein FtsX